MSTTFSNNLFWRVQGAQTALKKGVNRTFGGCATLPYKLNLFIDRLYFFIGEMEML